MGIDFLVLERAEFESDVHFEIHSKLDGQPSHSSLYEVHHTHLHRSSGGSQSHHNDFSSVVSCPQQTIPIPVTKPLMVFSLVANKKNIYIIYSPSFLSL